MEYALISFDLQGTLTNSAFSDEFWMEMLPELYAKKYAVSTEAAKRSLKNIFEKIGVYDPRYYSIEYWLKELGVRENFHDLVLRMRHRPEFYRDTAELLKGLRALGHVLIISSSTTRQCIEVELGDHRVLFDRVFSSLDDCSMAGKPPEFYARIAQEMRIHPRAALHVGDSKEMDVENATSAGWHSFYFHKDTPRDALLAELKRTLL